MTKRCARCKEEKLVTDFCRNKHNRDGLTSYCKACLRHQRTAHRSAHPRPKAPDLRQCKTCGASFSKAETGGRIRYCSEECFGRRRHQPPVIELRKCAGCGTTFEASKWKGYKDKEYCSPKCCADTKSQKNMLKVRTCRWCGQGFTRAKCGPQAQFCSDECKRASRRAGRLVASRKCAAAAERATCAKCELRFHRRPNSDRTICRPCQQGKPTEHGLSTTYSNRGCRCPDCTAAMSAERLQNKYKQVEAGNPLDVNHRARARRFGAPHININKLWVFERDGWLCGICHEPVDREAKWPAPMSATIDHIVPLARGRGSPGHVYENVQCAHWRCNAVKNDGTKISASRGHAARERAECTTERDP